MKPSERGARGGVRVGPSARRDLDDAIDYLRGESPELALRFARQVAASAAAVARFPGMCARTSLGSRLADVRRWTVHGFPAYVIFYRPIEDGIEVVRVLHGARDIEALFEADE